MILIYGFIFYKLNCGIWKINLKGCWKNFKEVLKAPPLIQRVSMQKWKYKKHSLTPSGLWPDGKEFIEGTCLSKNIRSNGIWPPWFISITPTIQLSLCISKSTLIHLFGISAKCYIERSSQLPYALSTLFFTESGCMVSLLCPNITLTRRIKCRCIIIDQNF